MDAGFWHERWKTSQTGFHQLEINTYLTRYWPELGLASGSRVLVPLCGKSLDMLWLREQGHSVIGVEVSDIAVGAFFRENGINPEITEKPYGSRCEHAGIELVCGDFFSLTPDDIGEIDAFYDRASLIALTSAQRPDYAVQLARLLQKDTPGLLITLDYNQLEMNGPPFAVPEDEVHRLFDESCSVEHLLRHDALAENLKFREKGLTRLNEHAYRLTRT
jgi:thiopurine S-methyltransferase